jgi:hypothetical protein
MPRSRWAPSPRAHRLPCLKLWRALSAFTRVFDALMERVGVRASCSRLPSASPTPGERGGTCPKAPNLIRGAARA